MTTAEAIQILTALTGAALRSAEAAQRVSQVIQRAQTEGRDLTDEEVAEIQSRRAAAVDRWNASNADR